jgi:branched-chain amino acid transport system substrate-binding protein
MNKKILGLTCAVASLTLLSAACSSSSSGSGAGAASGTASSSGKSPITVMSIDLTPLPGLDVTLGAKAAVAAVNAAGGIDGHPLNYEFCSNGTVVPFGDPNSSAACAAKAAQQGVAATVSDFTGYDNVVFPALLQAKIASVAEQPVAALDNTSQDSFPIVGSISIIDAGIGYQLAKSGCKKEVLLLQQGDAGDQLDGDSFEAGAKYGGGDPSTLQLPDTTADFAPVVAKVNSEGIDCIGNGFTAGSATQPLMTAVKAADTNTLLSIDTATATESSLKALGSAAVGVLGVNTAVENAFVSYTDLANATPQEKQMIANERKYEPAALAYNALDWIGYASILVFQDAAEKVLAAGKPVTSANIMTAMNSLTVNTGIYPTIDFGTPGGVPGQPRLFNTAVNFFKIGAGDAISATSTASVDMAPAFK